MRERRRKHDDVHHPLQGRGKRAPRGGNSDSPRIIVDNGVQCPGCGANQTNEHGACFWCGTVYREAKQ